jgi:hypothetical protein
VDARTHRAALAARQLGGDEDRADGRRDDRRHPAGERQHQAAIERELGRDQPAQENGSADERGGERPRCAQEHASESPRP